MEDKQLNSLAPNSDDIIKNIIETQNWLLAPMNKGRITRNKDGTKTFPNFFKDYRDKAINNPITSKNLQTALRPYYALTGKESNIVALDCDNEVTASIISALDSSNAWRIYPTGKEGITLIYRYDEDFKASFSTKRAPLEFDFLSTGKGFFMPTVVNETKEVWVNTPEGQPPEMPEPLKDFLLNFIKFRPTPSKEQTFNSNAPNSYPALYPLVEDCIKTSILYTSLLKMLTPNKSKAEFSKEYNKKGYLSPGDIPKGSGSTYLLSISTVLGSDDSVSGSMYTKIMTLFNTNLQSPLDDGRLQGTIIRPMLNKKSIVDGRVIWQYNKNWRDSGLTLIDKNKDLLMILVNKLTYENVIVNMLDNSVYYCTKAADAASTLRMITGNIVKPQLIETRACMKEIVIKFGEPFGILKNQFNIFNENENLKILRNPSLFTDKYKHTVAPQTPDATLAFLKHLIPDNASRIFLIRFLKTKLTTFKHSPIVFNITGKPGSGKDLFFDWLSLLIGVQYTSKPALETFLSRFNDWAENRLFVSGNEYADSLKPSDRPQAKGRLKELSGNTSFMCESKGKKAHEAHHSITFFLFQNTNIPLSDPGDRRHVYFKTPTPLLEWEDLNNYESAPGAGNEVDNLIKLMRLEQPAFCYYLATKVTQLSNKNYSKAPLVNNNDKYLAIDDKTQRLAEIIKNKDWEYLSNILMSLDNISEIDKELMHRSRLSLELCKEIINYWGYSASSNHLNFAFSDIGIDKAMPKRLSQGRVRAYDIAGLNKMDLGWMEHDFEAVKSSDEIDVGLDGSEELPGF